MKKSKKKLTKENYKIKSVTRKLKKLMKQKNYAKKLLYKMSKAAQIQILGIPQTVKMVLRNTFPSSVTRYNSIFCKKKWQRSFRKIYLITHLKSTSNKIKNL